MFLNSHSVIPFQILRRWKIFGENLHMLAWAHIHKRRMMMMMMMTVKDVTKVSWISDCTETKTRYLLNFNI
jgi:hypothetical protein